MRGKKALSFLLLRPAFNQRNFGTIGLVVLLFAVYTVVGGGKKPEIPAFEPGTVFGSVKLDPKVNGGTVPETQHGISPKPVSNGGDRESAESVIGIQPSEDETQRIKELDKRGRLFDPDVPDDDGEDRKPIDKSALVQGVEIKRHRDEWMLLRSEKRKADTLAAIEDRLSMKRRRKNTFPQSTGDPQ